MNKITNYMKSQTGKNYTNADLLNFIRSEASESYQRDIPRVNTLTKINHNNIPYAAYEIHQNEFFNILINRIGMTVVKSLSWTNPLSIFKTENFDFGETYQEIYVGLAEAQKFDAKSEEHPYKFYDTDIKAFYHDINREDKYIRTIERSWTQKAFANENSFDSFIDRMLTSILASDQLDEYSKIKDIITKSLTPVKAYGKTLLPKATKVNTTDKDWLIDFNKDLIKRVNLFKTPSKTRFENQANVPQVTDEDDIYLLVSAKLSSDLDMMLANAFNMNKASVMAKKIVVDDFERYFGEGTFEGAKPVAVLLSKNTLILKDKLFTMVNQFNPNTLSYNYYLHHHQIISYSLFENMHIYYDNSMNEKEEELNRLADEKFTDTTAKNNFKKKVAKLEKLDGEEFNTEYEKLKDEVSKAK